MKPLLQKVFARRKETSHSADLGEITRVIRPLIQNETFDMFYSHGIGFMDAPINCVVPAVWGIKEDGRLTPDQQEINMRVQKIVERVIAALDVERINSSQRFAIGFLVRELIIARLLLFIQIFNGELTAQTGGQEEDLNILNNLDAWGSA